MNKDFDNIDDLAQDAFKNFEVDFNPEDWKRMEARLDKKEHQMPHIWLFKGIEALVVALIIFTSVNLWFSQNGNNSLASSSDNTASTAENQTNSNVQEENTLSSATQSTVTATTDETNSSTAKVSETEENGQLLSGTNAGKTKGATTNTNLNNQAGQNAATGLNKTQKPNTKQEVNGRNTYNSVLHNNTTNKAAAKQSGTTATSAIPTKNAENNPMAGAKVPENTSNVSTLQMDHAKSEQEQQPTDAFSSAIVNIEPIDITRTEIKNSNGGGDEDNNGVKIESSFKLPKIYYRQLRMAMFAGGDINLASSIGDANLGMSMGVLVENEISERFAIRTGLVVSRKSYDNYYVEMIDRSATEGVIYESQITKTTTLGTLQIPVYLNCIAYRDPKWKLSFNAGAAVQLLTHRHVSGTQRTTLYQQAGGMVSVSEINPYAQEKGAWQGGATGLNTYVIGGFGFELERRLGDRVSLFMQPTYQHAFTKVGEAGDYLHTFSLNVGLKTILK